MMYLALLICLWVAFFIWRKYFSLQIFCSFEEIVFGCSFNACVGIFLVPCFCLIPLTVTDFFFTCQKGHGVFLCHKNIYFQLSTAFQWCKEKRRSLNVTWVRLPDYLFMGLYIFQWLFESQFDYIINYLKCLKVTNIYVQSFTGPHYIPTARRRNNYYIGQALSCFLFVSSQQ